MESDRIPGRLDAIIGYLVMFEELANSIGTVHLEAIGFAAELLQESQIMEGCGNEDELHIELLSRSSA